MKNYRFRTLRNMVFLTFVLVAVSVLNFPYAFSAVQAAHAGNEFANVRVHPNPWRVDRDSSDPNVTFDGLPASSSLKLFTVSGHLVRTLDASGGVAGWNLKNDSGDRVASGIYLYLLSSPSGEHTSGKVVVIK